MQNGRSEDVWGLSVAASLPGIDRWFAVETEARLGQGSQIPQGTEHNVCATCRYKRAKPQPLGTAKK
jgi:hypothetical protein